jgi:thymidine kinase
MYIDGRTPFKEINEKSKKRRLGHIFIDEGQFIKGIFEEVRTRMYQGYKFYITGLMRDFTMKPFNEIANLLTIADNINVMHAYCEACGREASESQRLVKQHSKWVKASYKLREKEQLGDGTGGKEEGKEIENRYEARCKDCLKVPGAPKPIYKFPRYTPPRSRREAIKAMDERQ